MNENILDQEFAGNSHIKFYSQRSILIMTFLFGPIATGILMRKNFLNLNEQKKANNALILGVVGTIASVLFIFLIPPALTERIPSILYSLVYTGIAQLIVENQMGEVLRNHKQENGAFYPIWKFALITIAAIVLLGIIAFLASDFMKAF